MYIRIGRSTVGDTSSSTASLVPGAGGLDAVQHRAHPGSIMRPPGPLLDPLPTRSRISVSPPIPIRPYRNACQRQVLDCHAGPSHFRVMKQVDGHHPPRRRLRGVWSAAPVVFPPATVAPRRQRSTSASQPPCHAPSHRTPSSRAKRATPSPRLPDSVTLDHAKRAAAGQSTLRRGPLRRWRRLRALLSYIGECGRPRQPPNPPLRLDVLALR